MVGVTLTALQQGIFNVVLSEPGGQFKKNTTTEEGLTPPLLYAASVTYVARPRIPFVTYMPVTLFF